MTVEVYIAVCLTVIVIAVCATTVFLAFTLWQLRRTARALEFLSMKFGDQMDRLGGLASVLGGAAVAATGRLGRGAALGASLIWGLVNFFRERRRARAAGETSESVKEFVR